jgi:hypothetical protein
VDYFTRNMFGCILIDGRIEVERKAGMSFKPEGIAPNAGAKRFGGMLAIRPA